MFHFRTRETFLFLRYLCSDVTLFFLNSHHTLLYKQDYNILYTLLYR